MKIPGFGKIPPVVQSWRKWGFSAHPTLGLSQKNQFPSSSLLPFLNVGKTPLRIWEIQNLVVFAGSLNLKILGALEVQKSYKRDKTGATMGFSTFFCTHFPFVSPIHGSFPRILLDFWNLWCLTCILLLVGAEPKFKKLMEEKKILLNNFFIQKKGRQTCFFWDYPAENQTQCWFPVLPVPSPTGSWAWLLWVLSKVN